jgi:hypothetical protein
MTTQDEARAKINAVLAERLPLWVEDYAQDEARKHLLEGLAEALLDEPVPAPWDGRGRFGHCDKEGWYSECVSKGGEPVPADEREALAKLLYDEQWAGPFCTEDGDLLEWGDLSEEYARHWYREADAVLALVRRQRPITDATVRAAYEAFVAGPTSAMDSMRAALEAAEAAR